MCMQRKPPVMRPNAARLRELRGDTNIKDLAVACGVDWRTLAIFETGQATDRFQFNTINQLAVHYGVPITSLVEEVPAAAAHNGQLRQRHISDDKTTPPAAVGL